MDAFSCVAAAASLGKNCLSTLKALYSLHEKYRNARTTIAALHSEITVIGASMQYINVIFEQHTDLAKTRFYENPELEQTFTAALAGCNLVLSCLDEEVEKILAGMGPKGSKGRKGKAQLLWREDVMKEVLHTLRGQHSAIFSIVQCLQVQNIAELGMKIEEVRGILAENHRDVEHTVRRSPSLWRLQSEGVANLEVDHNEHRLELPSDTIPTSENDQLAFPSSEKVAESYKHYHATIPRPSMQEASSRTSHSQRISWINNGEGSVDEAVSIRGLAPSTIYRAGPLTDEDFSSDRLSIVSAITTSSWTKKWLEGQLGPEDTTKALKRMHSAMSMSQVFGRDAENSIVAADLQTFLEHIRYFMPVLADFESEEGPAESNAETMARSRVISDTDTILRPPSPLVNAGNADTIPDPSAKVIGTPEDQLPLPSTLTADVLPEETAESSCNELEDAQSGQSFFSSREGRSSYTSVDSEILETIGRDIEAASIERKGAEYSEAEINTSGSASSAQGTTGLSIYVERHLYPRGTVICTPATRQAPRMRHSFSQALTPELQSLGSHQLHPDSSIGSDSASQQDQLLLHSMGARVFFVKRSTDQPVSPEQNQQECPDSDSGETRRDRDCAQQPPSHQHRSTSILGLTKLES